MPWETIDVGSELASNVMELPRISTLCVNPEDVTSTGRNGVGIFMVMMYVMVWVFFAGFKNLISQYVDFKSTAWQKAAILFASGHCG